LVKIVFKSWNIITIGLIIIILIIIMMMMMMMIIIIIIIIKWNRKVLQAET
jgi:hypothetical protein